MTAHDAERVRQMAAELTQKQHRLDLCLQPVSAVQIAGLIQLALRHPSLPVESAAATAGRRLLAGIREYFADCPTVLAVIECGDHPEYDRAFPEAPGRR